MNSGLTVEEKLHRLSYKMQWGEEKYLEMWGVRVDCEILRALRGALGAILTALRGDQGKVTTSSCDTEDDGSGPRSSSCAYHSEWGLEVDFSRAEGGKCLEETKGHPLLL